MSGIELDDVTKIYPNGVTAVDDVELEIADGEFMVLVGPSGCGKSTLLRMIAGLEDVTDRRDLRSATRDVTDKPPQQRDIAMVFQNYALYPHMTVRDNLAYGLKLRKMPKAEWQRRVRRSRRTLGLDELLERKPAALSGGQRQRVAMGRAIVREPKAFLMDEPLSNLDAKLRVSMRAELAKLHDRLGVTTVYVTHDQVEAMTLGQRVAVLRDGVLQQVDTPQNLFHKPDQPLRRRLHRLAVDEPRRRGARRRRRSLRRLSASTCPPRLAARGRDRERHPRHPPDRLRARGLGRPAAAAHPRQAGRRRGARLRDHVVFTSTRRGSTAEAVRAATDLERTTRARCSPTTARSSRPSSTRGARSARTPRSSWRSTTRACTSSIPRPASYSRALELVPGRLVDRDDPSRVGAVGEERRERAITDLAERQFDLLVVGGGIVGAAIAAEAARGGLSVALVERNDFGSGTTAASSKLIHGGLRYLRLGDVRLVHEAHRERRLLTDRIAPHLVRRTPFLLPLYRDGPHRPLAVYAGLGAYAALARSRLNRPVPPARARARVPRCGSTACDPAGCTRTPSPTTAACASPPSARHSPQVRRFSITPRWRHCASRAGARSARRWSSAARPFLSRHGA